MHRHKSMHSSLLASCRGDNLTPKLLTCTRPTYTEEMKIMGDLVLFFVLFRFLNSSLFSYTKPAVNRPTFFLTLPL